MGTRFPYFYYDALARVVPGVATIAVLVLTVAAWGNSGDGPRAASCRSCESLIQWLGDLVIRDPPAWASVVLPIVGLGVAYAIGSMYEGLFAQQTRGLIQQLFEKAAAEYQWRRKIVAKMTFPGWTALPPTPKPDHLCHHAWNWLVFCGTKQREAAFAHAHRFQADSKMFMHLTVPTVLASLSGVIYYWHHEEWRELCVYVEPIPKPL